MAIYYIIYVFIAFFSFLEAVSVKYRQRLFLLFILWVCLTLFAGLRYDNPDWEAYYDIYKEIVDGSGIGVADVGFNLLCKALSFFSTSPIIMFLVVAGSATAFNLESFKKYSPYFLICVLYYFVHLYVLKEMIQIRAGLASAICLYSIRYLADQRYKRFFLTWLFAVSIHMSAVVWIGVWIFSKRQIAVKALKWLLLLCLCIGLVYPLGQLVKLFAGGIDERLSAYIAYGDSGYAAELGILTNINALKSLAVATVLLFFSDKLKQVSKFFIFMLYAYIAGVCWMMLFNDFAIIGARISNILLCVEPVLISYLAMLLSKNSRLIFVAILVLLTLTMLTLNIGPDKITPYQFYFS